VACLGGLPLPAVARALDGPFLVIARAAESQVLVALADGSSTECSLTEFEAQWSGEAILVTKREQLTGAASALSAWVKIFNPDDAIISVSTAVVD